MLQFVLSFQDRKGVDDADSIGTGLIADAWSSTYFMEGHAKFVPLWPDS